MVLKKNKNQKEKLDTDCTLSPVSCILSPVFFLLTRIFTDYLTTEGTENTEKFQTLIYTDKHGLSNKNTP